MTTKKPRLSTLAFAGFALNAYLSRRTTDMSFAEVYKSLEAGTLLDDLSGRIGMDFSLFPAGSPEQVAVVQVLRDVAGGLEGRERRKVGVETSGLHLLLAFVLEAMQQGYWEGAPARAD